MVRGGSGAVVWVTTLLGTERLPRRRFPSVHRADAVKDDGFPDLTTDDVTSGLESETRGATVADGPEVMHIGYVMRNARA